MSTDASASQVQELMDECTLAFLSHVIRSKKVWRGGVHGNDMGHNTSGFATLWPENAGYNEYKTFEQRLEYFIRTDLVNPILFGLFEMFGIHVLTPTTTRYLAFANNKWFEEYYECQFIVEDNDGRIAYRYTDPNPVYVDVPSFIANEKIDRVVVIDWTVDTEGPARRTATSKELEQYYENVYEVSAGTFLHRYFPDSVCTTFLNTVRKAVTDANNILGFQTISRIGDSQLGEFKARVLAGLRDYEHEPKVYKQKRDARRRRNWLPEDDVRTLDGFFFGNGFYRSLCGEEDFATSFLTSEYLYSVFDEDDRLDYTAVVSGYIKAVEQLAHKFMKMTLGKDGTRELWIKKNHNDPPTNSDGNAQRMVKRRYPFGQRDRWSPHVRFVPQNEDCFDTTLVPMANLLHDHVQGWRISKCARHFFIYKVREFASFDRNGYMHKDNLLDKAEVDRIRSNAYLLIYILLGGYVIEEPLPKQYELLGIGPVQYDEMYGALRSIPSSQNRYVLEFHGCDPVLAIRLYKLEDEVEAREGGSSSPKLLFVKVPSFHRADIDNALDKTVGEDVIELSRSRLPERIMLVVREGEDERILWERVEGA